MAAAGELACGSLESAAPLAAAAQAAEEEPILQARLQTGYGPDRLAGIVRQGRSTVWKVLSRHGALA